MSKKHAVRKVEDLAREAAELSPEQAAEVEGGYSWSETQVGGVMARGSVGPSSNNWDLPMESMSL